MTGNDRTVSRGGVEPGRRVRRTDRDEIPRPAGGASSARAPIPKFEAVLQRAERLRQASLDAHFLRSTVDSFGEALWVWLSKTMQDPAAALPQSVDPACLRTGRLRAPEIAADGLLAICRSGRLEPVTFVALVAQDLEQDVRERIERRSFQSREQLTRTVREYSALMQHLQSILTAPAVTSGGIAPVGLGAPGAVDDAHVLALLKAHYEPELRRWARRRVPRSLRTEELVQETLMTAARHLEALEGRQGAVLAYLRTILMNKVRDEIRRSWRRSALDSEAEIADLDPNLGATGNAPDREADFRDLAALAEWMRKSGARTARGHRRRRLP